MSLVNYEKITEELTPEELAVESFVQSAFRKCVDEKNAMKGKDLVMMINHRIATEYDPSFANMTEVRLRKFVNYYRSNGYIPVCASSLGYFISFDADVLETQVKSLTSRGNSIMTAAHGLAKWIKR